jgi:putative RNA 2'-phosphotransferase
MTRDLVSASRFLSYVLRHNPDAVGVRLDEAGWVDIDTLLAALRRHGRPITPEVLARVVAGTDKQRFQVEGGRIRAAQGHTVAVDLRLEPVPPPAVLFHGTVARFLSSILAEGLTPRGRSHVHLSADLHTAMTVGARRGKAVVLRIDAAGMHVAGYRFYRAANGVWLTDEVPARWIGRQATAEPSDEDRPK